MATPISESTMATMIASIDPNADRKSFLSIAATYRLCLTTEAMLTTIPKAIRATPTGSEKLLLGAGASG